MSDFRETVPEQFRVGYDRTTRVFRVVDTWNEQIRNLPDLEADVPDTSPAVKILSFGEVNALVGELKKMGLLQHILGLDVDELPIKAVKISTPEKTIKELAVEKIAAVASLEKDKCDAKVGSEAIQAIREITQSVR